MTIQNKLDNLNIEGLRRLSGKTIKEIAETVRLTPKTYRQYEKNPINFTLGQAITLAGIFEIEISEFLKIRGLQNESNSSIQKQQERAQLDQLPDTAK